MNEIKRGCVARCSLGLLGLVTSDTKVLTRYGDQAWTGVQLDPDKAGKEWCSRNPTFVANSVAELIREKVEVSMLELKCARLEEQSRSWLADKEGQDE